MLVDTGREKDEKRTNEYAIPGFAIDSPLMLELWFSTGVGIGIGTGYWGQAFWFCAAGFFEFPGAVDRTRAGK